MSKIFQITESLEIGGAERVVATLSNALCERHEVVIVCLKQVGALAATLDSRVRVVCLNKREGQDPAALWRLIQLVRRERPAVLHTHDWGVYLDAVMAATFASIPNVVQTVHGRYMAGASGVAGKLKRRIRHLLERASVSQFGNLVCVSESLREHIEQEIGVRASQTITLMNGVAVEQQPPAARTSQDGSTRFVAVGRLAPVKNFQLMIRAFATMRDTRMPVQLDIVGDGPERSSLEALTASLDLCRCVNFLGFRSDIDALLRDSDVFLLSSTSEGIPMSILEAMRSARPVIATDVGGVPALVEHDRTGLLVRSEDVNGFAAAMQRLASNLTLAQTMGCAGHARARRLFSIEAMVAGYERLYAGSVPAPVSVNVP